MSVAEGNELTPTQVQNEPNHIEWPIEEGGLYTLCMTGNVDKKSFSKINLQIEPCFL